MADTTRVNKQITAPEVFQINSDGFQVGVTLLQEAISAARHERLDLVEVAAAANPPVCRIMDYSDIRPNGRGSWTSANVSMATNLATTNRMAVLGIAHHDARSVLLHRQDKPSTRFNRRPRQNCPLLRPHG